MIRIVSTKRLAALRAEAAQVPELRDRVAALTSGLDRLNESAEWHSRQAEEARADAERARAETDRALDDVAARVAADVAVLKAAVNDPDPSRAEQVKGMLALAVLRQQLARVKAEGDAERLAGPVRLLDMLLSEDTDAAEAADTGTDTGTCAGQLSLWDDLAGGLREAG